MINMKKGSCNSNVSDKNDENDKIEIDSLKKYCNEYYNRILINEKLLNWVNCTLGASCFNLRSVSFYF